MVKIFQIIFLFPVINHISPIFFETSASGFFEHLAGGKVTTMSAETLLSDEGETWKLVQTKRAKSAESRNDGEWTASRRTGEYFNRAHFMF